MDYLDIIVFAALAVFIFARLWAVLGRRNEDEPQKSNPFTAHVPVVRDEEDVMVLPDRARSPETPVITAAGHALTSLAGVLDQIKGLDPFFDEKQFLQGAKTAFSLIVEGFARGDLSATARWLAPSVLDSFQKAVAARQDAGHVFEGKVERIADAEISAAKLDGSRALLTVTFVSVQANVLRDGHGQVLSGTPGQAEEIRDAWGFSRDLQSTDPNWILVETRSA
jgi:predicted lipid-binding transport protein (Tim44 family)